MQFTDLIIDDRRQARFKVHRSAFVSDEILALEREHVFAKCWLYLGHTSELKKPGDFISRRVGGRPLLYTRDRDNKLHAVYNTCPHRGALVCRERSGNRRAFTCGYHAWTFDEKGRFVGMPGREALPPDATENCKLDLVHVERMEEFRGFVFVCFDKNAMSLRDYLAGAAEYLEYVADQGRDGMEIVTGTQDYCVGANWKLLQENSADGYHGVPTHSTYFDYIRSRDNSSFGGMNSKGWVKNLGNGHAVSESIGLLPWGRPYARWAPGWGEEARQEVEALNKEIMERLGPERGNVVANGDRNLLVFPNLVVNDVMATTVRTFYPVRPDHMEVSAWCIAPVGESDTSRDRRLRNFVEFLGPAGFATPDDVEMLELCQRGYANLASAPYNDLSRGMLSNAPTKTDELQMRTFWRRWHQLVSGNPALERGAVTMKLSRSDAEDFLIREAALLDAWKLLEWADLFTEDGEYLVPATDDPEGKAGKSLFLIYDDRHRLGERAKRLLKPTAHAESPHSRTRHMISNVVTGEATNGAIPVTCNFVVFRSRMEVTNIYPGHAEYQLVQNGDGLRIRSKKAVLDVDALRPHGKISIIL